MYDHAAPATTGAYSPSVSSAGPVPGRSSRSGGSGMPPNPAEMRRGRMDRAIGEANANASPEDRARNEKFRGLTEHGLTTGDASGEATFESMYQAIEDLLRRLKDTNPAYHAILSQIPIQELMAIRGYAQGDYSPINASMRGYEPRESQQPRPLKDPKLAAMPAGDLATELAPYIQLIQAGLAKLPPTPGRVFRVMSLDPEADKDLWQQYATEGSVITDKAFHSTTANGDIMSAKVFAGPMYVTGNVYLTIDHTSGRRIQDLSAYKVEDEVLFAPNTSFKVIGVKQSTGSQGKPRLDVLMQEVGGAA